MALQINLTGLTADRYLFNNPIWIAATNLGLGASSLQCTISRTDVSGVFVTSRFFIFSDTVEFDISEYIKGMCDYPNYPTGIVLNNQDIETNYYPFTITLNAVNPQGQLTSSLNLQKTFIRGGLENQQTNVALPNGTILKESVKIPVWNGYEKRIYKIENNTIIMTTDIPNGSIENMVIKSCNPLYFRFVNMLGGYSYWLFENWDFLKKTDKTQVIDRRDVDISTGNKSSYSLNVSGRVDRRYFKVMRALIQSPEIQVLNLSNKVNEVSGFVAVNENWEQVWSAGNQSSINALQKVNQIKLKFDYVSTMQTQTIW
tara:strand:+ start:451 stop:1395 length:945 start_codon:yes stop_codon:yes gene_type:complete